MMTDEQKQQRNKRCNINSQALLEKKVDTLESVFALFLHKIWETAQILKTYWKTTKTPKNANKKFENFPKAKKLPENLKILEVEQGNLGQVEKTQPGKYRTLSSN